MSVKGVPAVEGRPDMNDYIPYILLNAMSHSLLNVDDIYLALRIRCFDRFIQQLPFQHVVESKQGNAASKSNESFNTRELHASNLAAHFHRICIISHLLTTFYDICENSHTNCLICKCIGCFQTLPAVSLMWINSQHYQNTWRLIP